MAQFFEIHPDNPQARLLKQAVALLARGDILAVPPTRVTRWSANSTTKPPPTACAAYAGWTTNTT